MEVKKITGRRDYIDVDFGDKAVRLPGELLVGGFAVAKGQPRVWKVPEGKPVTESERAEIKRAVVEDTKGSHFVVVFD